MKKNIDIVLPCYMPQKNWHVELLEFNSVAAHLWDVNYIVVNDGTPGTIIEDSIAAISNKGISISYITYHKNQGKGFALREGIKAATSNYIVYTDIDFPFKNESTLNLIKLLLEDKYDVIAGFRDAIYYQQKMTRFRKILSTSFRFFIRRVLKMKVTDTQCGLKGFNVKGKETFLTTTINRYLFDFEFIYMACKSKSIAITPFNVELKENVSFSKMKSRILIQEMFNLILVLLNR